MRTQGFAVAAANEEADMKSTVRSRSWAGPSNFALSNWSNCCCGNEAHFHRPSLIQLLETNGVDEPNLECTECRAEPEFFDFRILARMKAASAMMLSPEFCVERTPSRRSRALSSSSYVTAARVVQKLHPAIRPSIQKSEGSFCDQSVVSGMRTCVIEVRRLIPSKYPRSDARAGTRGLPARCRGHVHSWRLARTKKHLYFADSSVRNACFRSFADLPAFPLYFSFA